MDRGRRWLSLIAVNLGIAILLLALIEGLASLGLLAYDLSTHGDFAERDYTTYDRDLGWISLPSVSRPNAFGVGVGVTTNAQRFRADHEIPASLPAGRLRLVAAGDSFTFGYGVGDEQAWLRLLETQNPWLETVNMAQGGYGLDQAYLRYRRDGALVAHDVAVLAFITNDFKRMELDRFLGYEKPWLTIDDGALAVRNSPVPKASLLGRWLLRRSGYFLELRLARSVRDLLGTSDDELAARAVESDIRRRRDGENPLAGQEAIVGAIIREFCALAGARSAVPMLVLLPNHSDAGRERGELRRWSEVVKAFSDADGVTFLDLAAEIRTLPPQRVPPLFLDDSHPPDIAGHFSAEGNAWAARVIGRRLSALRALRVKAADRGVELPPRGGGPPSPQGAEPRASS